MKGKLKNKKVILVFACFFFYLLLQNHFMWLFHDDYGYASLSYLTKFEGNRGLNASLIDVINFLIFHYQNWGGRVLWFFVEIILLKLGLPIYRLFQSVLTLGMFILIYKIIKKKANIENSKVALFCVLCYGLFEIVLLRGGVYWITASVLYFLPLFPLLLFIYLYDGNNKNILCGILIFISTWAQEQVAVLSISYIFLYTIHNWIVLKNKNKKDIIMCCISLLAFLILMLSGGTASRTGNYSDFYNLPIYLKFGRNAASIILNNFGKYTKLFTYVFLLSSIYITCENRNKIKNKLLNSISIISTLIILMLTIITEEGYFTSLYIFSNSDVYKGILLIVFIIQLSLILYNILYYFYEKKQYVIIYIFIAALLSQISMLVAPYFPLRSATMFELMCFVIFTYVFADILKNKKLNIYAILLPMIIVSTFNLTKITYGYYINNDEQKYNDKILKETSKKIKNGKNIKFVNLRKLQNHYYGIEQPYDEGFDYIAYYMKFYYDIPQSVEFIYE